jgi:hypothetical protein
MNHGELQRVIQEVQALPDTDVDAELFQVKNKKRICAAFFADIVRCLEAGDPVMFERLRASDASGSYLDVYERLNASGHPTYIPGQGRGEPRVSVDVDSDSGSGIGLTLPRGHGEYSDVFIERRPREWAICIAPDGENNQQIIHISDAGEMIVSRDMLAPGRPNEP